MCSHLAPNLVTRNAGNRRSWELNFRNFPEGRIQGGRGWGSCAPSPPLPLFGFLFYKIEVYEQKVTIKRVRNLCQNAGNCHFQIFKNLWGSMPPNPHRKLAPSALCVPLPLLKDLDPLLDPLEISHAQQPTLASLDSFIPASAV